MKTFIGTDGGQHNAGRVHRKAQMSKAEWWNAKLEKYISENIEGLFIKEWDYWNYMLFTKLFTFVHSGI